MLVLMWLLLHVLGTIPIGARTVHWSSFVFCSFFAGRLPHAAERLAHQSGFGSTAFPLMAPPFCRIAAPRVHQLQFLDTSEGALDERYLCDLCLVFLIDQDPIHLTIFIELDIR